MFSVSSTLFCQTCNKCPISCLKSACKGQASKRLESLGNSGCRSEIVTHSETRLHPPLSDPAELDKVTHNYKLLWQSSQEPLPTGGIASAYKQKCRRVGQKSRISGLLQSICTRWLWPQIDLFATKFNNKLPLLVSPVTDPLASAVVADCLPWEDLYAYAFPPAAILGKVV